MCGSIIRHTHLPFHIKPQDKQSHCFDKRKTTYIHAQIPFPNCSFYFK